jgi:RNA polymerase sigma-70 factor (ECF subfamily)
MSDEPLQELLERLGSGDLEAAAVVFRAYEPYLRKVVRRQLPATLRAKFDSTDVVQSVWADLLEGFRDRGWRFPDANHLRAFLLTATRHRFIDGARRHGTAVDREISLEVLPPTVLPERHDERPSEVAQANELWERLLALAPPEHRAVLELKRQGLSAAEIAGRTNLHEDSVRRILRDLASRLAARTPLS